MEFDKEMDEAALKIQKHYKNKKKKPQAILKETAKNDKNTKNEGKIKKIT